MFVLVLAAEADETRRTVTFLIASLVGIAVLLALMTVWYWYLTSPRRQARQDAAGGTDVDVDVDDVDRAGGPDPIGPAVVTGPVAGSAIEAGTGTATGTGGEQQPGPGDEPGETEPSEDEVEGEKVPAAVEAAADRPDHGGTPPPASVTAEVDTPLPPNWDLVAAARRAEEGERTGTGAEGPSAARITVGLRNGSTQEADGEEPGDELAAARLKRERRTGNGLSDEAWDAVRRSVFDKLDR